VASELDRAGSIALVSTFCHDALVGRMRSAMCAVFGPVDRAVVIDQERHHAGVATLRRIGA
jgi:hypothetical protein